MLRRSLLTTMTFGLATATLPPAVFALDPIYDIIDSEIRTNSAETLDDVRKAIIAGAKSRRWRMSEIAPGHLEAHIMVRSHTATVDILFDTAKYSITYKESDNLKYKDGLIHRNYNKWVRNLDLAIQKSLSY